MNKIKSFLYILRDGLAVLAIVVLFTMCVSAFTSDCIAAKADPDADRETIQAACPL